jgi:hypothetical protein
MSDLEPRVCVDPQVYNNTAGVRVRCVPLPGVGAVSAGTGAVLFSPTHTVPVQNPIPFLLPPSHAYPYQSLVVRGYGPCGLTASG